MIRKQILTLILIMLAAMAAGAQAPAEPDDTASLHGNWVQQLWQTGFHINDPRIRYPRFANFCRKEV